MGSTVTSTSRNKGTCVCSNKLTIKADVLENAVLSALETHLMRDKLVQVFCEKYQKSLNELRSAHSGILKKQKAEQYYKMCLRMTFILVRP